MLGLKSLQALFVASTLVAAHAALAASTEDLIGEELITSTTVYPFANRMYAETKRILASGGWVTLSNTNGILNEGKAVSGVFAAAGVNVTRASGVVNAPARTLFNYLITAKGYQLIDPLSNPEDFSKPPLESFSTAGWRGASSTGKKLEVARTEAFFDGIRPREFVVLNAIDASTRTFVSKSIQHKGDPGCSLYGGAACYSASAVPVRALNTFAVQIEPLKSNASRCTVQLINYADLTPPEIPAVASNGINTPFLPEMLGRMRAAYP